MARKLALRDIWTSCLLLLLLQHTVVSTMVETTREACCTILWRRSCVSRSISIDSKSPWALKVPGGIGRENEEGGMEECE